MKRFIPLLTVLFCISPVLAQESTMATGKLGTVFMDAKNLQKDLDLTDDQVEKLNTAREEEQSRMQAISQTRQDLMKRLEDQVKAQAPDTDLQATLGELEMNRKTIQDLGDKYRGEKDALLTPVQRAKMLLLPKNAPRQAMMRRRSSRK